MLLSHVVRAALNPIDLDDRQVNAVAARIELDLRLGASFTRFQTLTLQAMGGDLAERVISYGNRLLHVLLQWLVPDIKKGPANFLPLALLWIDTSESRIL